MVKTLALLFAFTLATSLNAHSWQWVKRGGGNAPPSGSSQNFESVKALAFDLQNNVFIMSPLMISSPDVDGNAVPSYGVEDFVLSSFSCDGTHRWSTTICGHSVDY